MHIKVWAALTYSYASEFLASQHLAVRTPLSPGISQLIENTAKITSSCSTWHPEFSFWYTYIEVNSAWPKIVSLLLATPILCKFLKINVSSYLAYILQDISFWLCLHNYMSSHAGTRNWNLVKSLKTNSMAELSHKGDRITWQATWLSHG